MLKPEVFQASDLDASPWRSSVVDPEHAGWITGYIPSKVSQNTLQQCNPNKQNIIGY